MAKFVCTKCSNTWEGKGPDRDGVICDDCRITNMDENELYVEQMKHWFKEQRLLGKQIEGSILFHEEMAKVNRLQLDLNDKRIELARAEYNAWAEKNGFPMF